MRYGFYVPNDKARHCTTQDYRKDHMQLKICWKLKTWRNQIHFVQSRHSPNLKAKWVHQHLFSLEFGVSLEFVVWYAIVCELEFAYITKKNCGWLKYGNRISGIKPNGPRLRLEIWLEIRFYRITIQTHLNWTRDWRFDYIELPYKHTKIDPRFDRDWDWTEIGKMSKNRDLTEIEILIVPNFRWITNINRDPPNCEMGWKINFPSS